MECIDTNGERNNTCFTNKVVGNVSNDKNGKSLKVLLIKILEKLFFVKVKL